MSIRLVLAAAAAAALALAAAPRRADACGGCFAPPDTITAVDSHRMVISLSPQQTVLWDQINYTGDPKDFVWVLPVPSTSPIVELADSAFFDEIDGATSPSVGAFVPPGACFGCCASGGADSAPGDGVIVYNSAVVGPYETVTIGAEDPDALQDWLVEHNYRVLESTVPTLRHYTEIGSAFVVLRLAPGQGVQSMQPVRVTYPGYMATFPLEMVQVGAQGALGLSLFVIAEQRYQPANYASVVIDERNLVYDWDTAQSNYEQAFAAAIQAAGGRAWVTEYAGPLSELWQINQGSDYQLASASLTYPYLTRLRTRMLVDYLDEDLLLMPAINPSPVSAQLQAGTELHSPYDDGCSMQNSPSSHALLLVFAVVGADLAWRVRRRRRRG